jgi:hypothetical protein
MRLALLAAAALVVAACGAGAGPEEQARESFGEYRDAHAVRGAAELELREVFGDIAMAAGDRDEESIVAAVSRGRDALATIDRSLERELAAAKLLAAYEPTSAEGRKLVDALEQSRVGVGLIARQLDIAVRDPFLDVEANADEIRRLSAESTRISVPAAFARRRAAHAIALALGVKAPDDPMFDDG